MTYKSVFFNRGLAMLAMAGSFAIVSGPALSQSTTTDGRNPGATKYDGSRPASPTKYESGQRPPRPLGRFEKMAERLQITPAQQSVWMQYRNAIETQMKAPPPLAPPTADADAVTLLRWRADRAADQARKLAAVADATDVLQRSLDGEQRKKLNELVREENRIPQDVRSDMRPPSKSENPVDSKQRKQ